MMMVEREKRAREGERRGAKTDGRLRFRPAVCVFGAACSQQAVSPDDCEGETGAC